MQDLIRSLIIICPLVFLAGFVDAVAGGGGLISLPAYMMAGLPTHIAAGSNKLSAGCGTIIAAGKYIRSGKIRMNIAVYSAVGAIVGSFMGTRVAIYLSEKHLKAIMLIAIPVVALFMLTQKNIGKETIEKNYSLTRTAVYSVGIGLVIGCYDGLIGPGTGTFLILAFSSILGLDLVTSSGCAKVSNLASNLTSMMLYLFNGQVFLAVALPAALSSTLGGYMGAKFAIKGGAKKVRYIIFVVIGLLFIKTIFDLL